MLVNLPIETDFNAFGINDYACRSHDPAITTRYAKLFHRERHDISGTITAKLPLDDNVRRNDRNTDLDASVKKNNARIMICDQRAKTKFGSILG